MSSQPATLQDLADRAHDLAPVRVATLEPQHACGAHRATTALAETAV